MGRRLVATLVAALAGVVAPTHALTVEILTAVGGLPPHVVGQFEDTSAFHQQPSGNYLVFDRRGQAIFRIPRDRSTATKLVAIGQEDGRIIDPIGFDVAEDGRFVVADRPRGRQRIQIFDADGVRTAGFTLAGQPLAQVVLGGVPLGGIGSIQFARRQLFVTHPESGSLITGYTPIGYPTQVVGLMRPTAFEADRELHQAMNAGFPLVDPTGGFYFVFMTGRPTFRKYDASGKLLFERPILGTELDGLLDNQPTEWPRRRVQDREVPFVAPVVRAAAVDPNGQLWISLAVPYVYVYDTEGDKVRALQLRAAGLVMPNSLSFSQRGTLLVTPGCYEFDYRTPRVSPSR